MATTLPLSGGPVSIRTCRRLYLLPEDGAGCPGSRPRSITTTRGATTHGQQQEQEEEEEHMKGSRQKAEATEQSGGKTKQLTKHNIRQKHRRMWFVFIGLVTSSVSFVP